MKLLFFFGKYFFLITLVVGMFVTFGLGGGLSLAYQTAPRHYYQPENRGFAIAHNHTGVFMPDMIEIEVLSLSDSTEIFFNYHFGVSKTGWYNIILIFPFDINEKLGSSPEMNITKTPFGTAISLSTYINKTTDFWEDDYVWGKFTINNTIQSGTRGEYTFSLPFLGGVGGKSELIDNLREEMGVAWHTPAGKVFLNFFVPAEVEIIQAYPETNITGPNIIIDSQNRALKRVQWNFNWLEQQFTVVCKNKTETQFYDSLLFFSGIFISLGSGVIIRALYDYSKEKVYEPYKKDKT